MDSLSHPASFDPDNLPRNLPPAILEGMADNPEYFAEFFRAYVSNKFWGMLRNFDNMTVSQQTELMKLATDVVGVKNAKKDASQTGPAFSISIVIPNAPAKSNSVTIEGVAAKVNSDE